MSTICVISGTGKDRVGIVAELAEYLGQHGCNLMDSSMTKLRNEFAIILMVSLSSEGFAAFKAGLETKKSELGLTITVRELNAEDLAEQQVADRYFLVRVYGADRTGIVARVTRELALLGLNVTDVQTKMITQEKGDVFVMLLEATAPESMTEHKVQSVLAPLSAELGVTISAEEIEVMEL
ncbi:MAG: amino acid-binding protein [Cyanobacteria bacterium SZAS LIN-2]|nr:amino acid-binding protein [Cyanobacteria bacterium SZAS LIN-2]